MHAWPSAHFWLGILLFQVTHSLVKSALGFRVRFAWSLAHCREVSVHVVDRS